MSATATLVALHHRERTGQGQFIDYAQSEGLIRSLDWTWVAAGLADENRGPAGNRDRALGASDIVRCRDGFVAIAAVTDPEFRGLAAAMGQPDLADDPRYATLAARLEPAHQAALLERVRGFAKDLGRADLEALGEKHGFAAARVATAKDRYDDAHLQARGSVWAYEDPLYGPMVEQGPAPKLSATPGRIRWAARPVGWHNEHVLRTVLGLAPAEIQALVAQGAVGRWADRMGAKPPDGVDTPGAV
jgi:crotonobetainyl-CoA:carnitine CoA-transferase CaiB-like acyl-CoA transferase